MSSELETLKSNYEKLERELAGYKEAAQEFTMREAQLVKSFHQERTRSAALVGALKEIANMAIEGIIRTRKKIAREALEKWSKHD